MNVEVNRLGSKWWLIILHWHPGTPRVYNSQSIYTGSDQFWSWCHVLVACVLHLFSFAMEGLTCNMLHLPPLFSAVFRLCSGWRRMRAGKLFRASKKRFWSILETPNYFVRSQQSPREFWPSRVEPVLIAGLHHITMNSPLTATGDCFAILECHEGWAHFKAYGRACDAQQSL